MPKLQMKKQARKPRRKARLPRQLDATRHDVASCSDVVGAFEAVSNNVYQLYNIALTNSSRAKSIAQGYQFYRISKVEVKWKPLVDTFTSSSTSAGSPGLSVPNLYYMIDKANTFPSNTVLDTLKQAGAKPVRLDDKIITRSFKPAIHLASDDGATGPASTVETAGMMKVSPWITTSSNAGGIGAVWTPNSVDHRGLVFCIEQLAANNSNSVATVEVVVHYQFKKPLWTTGAQQQTVFRVDLDTLEIQPPEIDPLPAKPLGE